MGTLPPGQHQIPMSQALQGLWCFGSCCRLCVIWCPVLIYPTGKNFPCRFPLVRLRRVKVLAQSPEPKRLQPQQPWAQEDKQQVRGGREGRTRPFLRSTPAGRALGRYVSRLDLSTAFNTTDHSNLLETFSPFGFSLWFPSSL